MLLLKKWSLEKSRNESQLLKGNVLNPRYKNFADTITYRTWLNCPQTRRTKLFYVCLFPSLCNFGSKTTLIWSVSVYKAEPTLIGKTRVTLLTRLDHWRFPAHAFWTVYWVYIKYLLNLSIISITINSNHNIVVFVVVVYSTKENFIFPFSLPFFFQFKYTFFLITKKHSW